MKKTAAKILIVDDDDDVLISAALYLGQFFDEIKTLNDPNEINTALNQRDIDVFLLDMNYRKGTNDGKEGLYWLSHILSIDKEAVVILMTAFGEIELAVKALKNGAIDFILKPWKNEKLLATIHAALELRKSKKKVAQLSNTKKTLTKEINKQTQRLTGNSNAINKVIKTIEKVAQTDATVLLLGENGTGKYVAAKEIYRHSKRNEEVFIHVDLGALSETIFESELFGYAQGAFTDAKEDTAGRFEVANGGTLFLDEIGNLSLPLQAKLLTVLQNRKITRLGESKERNIDIRLICATNMPLDQMVIEGTFRQDLLYRINTIEILLPPLRERENDIDILAQCFLKEFNLKYQKKEIQISPEALSMLKAHSWPGNIRELQHTIERAVILSNGEQILETDLGFKTATTRTTDTTLNLPNNLNINDIERLLVSKALEKHSGNITNTAKELGLTRAALYRRIEKYNL